MRWWLAFFVLLTLAACNSYKNEDYAAMNEIPIQTMCVGRMLVDLPKGQQRWQQQFDYARVSRLPATVNSKEAFDAYVEKRQAEFRKRTEQNPEGRLFKYIPVTNKSTIILFRGKGIRADSLHTERYLWAGNWGYLYETGALTDDDALNLASISAKHFNQVIPIQNTNPPDKPGFCIDSALVTGDTGSIDTSVTAKVRQWPGVAVYVGTGVDDGSRIPLPWQRTTSAANDHHQITGFYVLELKQSSAEARQHNNGPDRVVSFDVLRKRETTMAGIEGQETAFRMELGNGQQYYEFDWTATHVRDNPDQFALSLNLSAGDAHVRTSYQAPPPEEKLLALWDAVLQSVEFRSDAR